MPAWEHEARAERDENNEARLFGMACGQAGASRLAATTEKETDMSDELAVMEGIGFGLRDVGQPCLWFTAKALNGAALQCLTGKEIADFVQASGVYDIRSLEGKPCVVKREGNMMIFVRLHT